MILDTVDEKKKGVHTRYLILLIIFIVTAVNYADRATLSIAGTEVAKELQLSAVSMGYIFSAFGWAYLLMQIPGGWLLDKFGSKKVYTYSLFFWSLFTFLQGFVDMFPLAWAGISMFFMRFMLGFSEAPSFPANARIVAAWFPTKERGTASAIFNSAQYFSLALFSPLLGWLGVFLTGSDTSSCALFGGMQKDTATAVGMSPELAVAANASGGVTAKMISPQSLSVATAATNMVGQEGNLFRFTIGHSIAMTLVLCVLTYLQAGPLSFMLP